MDNLNTINKAKFQNLISEKPSPTLLILINLKRIIATLNPMEKRLKKVPEMPKPKQLFPKLLKAKRIIPLQPLLIKALLTSHSMSHLISLSVSRRL